MREVCVILPRWMKEAFHLARYAGGCVTGIASLPATGITTLAVKRVPAGEGLLAARGRDLLCFDLTQRRWMLLGTMPGVIQEIHPAPEGGRGRCCLPALPLIARSMPARCGG